MLEIDYNTLYIHFPKTGGTFIRTLVYNYLPHEKIGNGDHTKPTLEICDKYPTIFTTVRNPVDWYISTWKFLRDWNKGNKSKPLEDLNPLRPMQTIYKPDVNMFLENVLKANPSYYQNAFFEFTANLPKRTRYVKTELLSYDLYHFIDVLPKFILKSVKHGQRNSNLKVNPRLAAEIIDANYKILDTYYL